MDDITYESELTLSETEMLIKKNVQDVISHSQQFSKRQIVERVIYIQDLLEHNL